MTGRWRVGPIGKGVHGSARLVLGTTSHLAACYSAPTVEVERSEAVAYALDLLGPDLLAGFDGTRFLERARRVAGRNVAEMLLDQRVLAGIGNVYKSEVLFLERVNPDTSVDDLGDDALLALARRAQGLLRANVGRARTTTGWRGPSRDTWVYGRSGKPCRGCGTAIVVEERAGRLTFWCPSCQPPESSTGMVSGG
jgi:endonuclease-8